VHGRRGGDVAAYVRRTRSGTCFVCAIVRGDNELPNPLVYEDELAIAWVNPYQNAARLTRSSRRACTGRR
jgi:hypothetical protein